MALGLIPDSPSVAVVVILVTTGIIWVGSGWLESAAEGLAAYYGLPAVVQGSVIIAVGSSFPELASVVITALSGSFSMGVGAIVGSAVFNVLVIPALSGIASKTSVGADRTIVYKEAQFYMIAVSALIITFALAVIYFPTDGAGLNGRITRPLAAIPLAMYGLYLFIQWQDVSDYESETPAGDIDVVRSWGTLALGLGTILVGVEFLVGGVETLNAAFGIPEFLAGVTIIAAATSLPDALVSVRAAKDGRGITSLGNVLGSNTFDLLVAIPVGVLIVGSATVSFAVAAPMFGVLTVATVLLFTLLRTDLALTGPEAYLLLFVYGVFVVWVVGETAGVFDLLVGI
ncbi:sodium:calcium antiporter [Halogeometricum sp. S1BR25-6]|uniref:Sodium:calcium antiporter n=1 Tax=Halogeometricum salsisoli TaxID=2950536 RepID=A0ABU2GIB0_9EURY|nr:sodium:calcium antiporter [Halogeometricum sp. S1BR25-6]MDS0300156.1 sodium:calcium antiporter [Halogeometricum sp. S1BR25-6]